MSYVIAAPEFVSAAASDLANLGATIVVVTHELASIFTIANNSVFLDAESRTQIATGDPHDMLAHSKDPRVRKFLTRGQEGGDSISSHD